MLQSSHSLAPRCPNPPSALQPPWTQRQGCRPTRLATPGGASGSSSSCSVSGGGQQVLLGDWSCITACLAATETRRQVAWPRCPALKQASGSSALPRHSLPLPAVFVGLTACMGSANANRLRTYLMLMVRWAALQQTAVRL